MLNLLLAIVSTTLVSAIMRISGKYSRNNTTMLACNYVMCSLMAAFFAGGQVLPAHEGLAGTMGLGAVGGFFYLVSFMLMQWNVKHNGVVMPTTFMKLGVIVPILMSVLLFGEAPRAVQTAGIVLALGAVIYMQGRDESIRSLSSLLLLWLTTGISTSMTKIYDEIGVPALKNQFLLYIFASALVMCLALCLVRRQRMGLWDVVFGLVIGIPNYLNSRFLLHALADLPAFVVYPCYSVGSILTVTLVGICVFGETISRRKKIALGMILCALVLLNL